MAKSAFLFDFDGVFNALPDKPSFRIYSDLPGAFQDYKQVNVKTKAFDREKGEMVDVTYPIRLALETIEWFNLLTEQSNIDVFWLTTWRDATEHFTDLFGFNQAPWLDWTDHDDLTKWGKSDAAHDFVLMNDYDNVVWVDDHHGWFYNQTRWTREHNILKICPVDNPGIRLFDIEQMMEFVNED